MTLSARVFTRNIGGKVCENAGQTITDEPVEIKPGKVLVISCGIWQILSRRLTSMRIYVNIFFHFQSKTLVLHNQDGEGSLGIYHSEHTDAVKKSDSGLPNFRLIHSAIGGDTVGVVNSEFNEKKSIHNGASVVWSILNEGFGDVVGETGKELGDLRVCLITEGGNSSPAVRKMAGVHLKCVHSFQRKVLSAR